MTMRKGGGPYHPSEIKVPWEPMPGVDPQEIARSLRGISRRQHLAETAMGAMMSNLVGAPDSDKFAETLTRIAYWSWSMADIMLEAEDGE